MQRFFSRLTAIALAVTVSVWMLPTLVTAQADTIKVSCDVTKDEIKIEPAKGESGGEVTWNFDVSIESCKTAAKDKILKEAGLDAVEIMVLKSDRQLPIPNQQLLRNTQAKWELGKGATIQAHAGIADAGDISILYKISFKDKADKELRETRAELLLHTGVLPTLTEWGLILLGLLLAGSLAFMIRRRFAPRPAGA